MTEIVPFEDLNKSTITMMVYSNLSFDLMKIFGHIPVTHIVPPLTRKKKKVDKKKLKASYGSVISVQYDVYIRGTNTGVQHVKLKRRERRFSLLRKLFALYPRMRDFHPTLKRSSSCILNVYVSLRFINFAVLSHSLTK